MNRGLVDKAVREIWLVTLVCGLALFLVELLLAIILPTFQETLLPAISRLSFVRPILRAVVGTAISDNMGPELFTAMAWAHPVVLTIVCAHAISCCTRVPAGEVDRGTIDVLLGLPISRWQLHVNETVVWVLSALVLLGCGALGNVLGSITVRPELRPGGLDRLRILVNLLCFYLSIGGVAMLASALSERRGRAVAIAVVVAVTAFLWNYVCQMWEPAEPLLFLSPLSYYRPIMIVRDGLVLLDIVVLTGLAAAAWTAAGLVAARRDLCTV